MAQIFIYLLNCTASPRHHPPSPPASTMLLHFLIFLRMLHLHMWFLKQKTMFFIIILLHRKIWFLHVQCLKYLLYLLLYYLNDTNFHKTVCWQLSGVVCVLLLLLLCPLLSRSIKFAFLPRGHLFMLTLLRAEINSEACQSGEAGAIFIPAQICTEAISRSLWKMHLQHEREESFSIPGSQSATCADAISSRVSNACSSLKWKKGERWYSRLILRGKWPDVTTDGAFPPFISDKKRKNRIHTQLHILLSFHLLN